MRPRVVHVLLFLLTLTALAVCWSGLPMIWDGAYQFAATVYFQEPYVYLTRFHTWALWQPLMLLSRHTEDFALLSFAFGLPFCLAPALSLAASWWMVRRHAPGLMLWAVFGVCAAGAPGQVFIINDSMWQQTLIWPVLLGALVPTTRMQRAALALLGICQLPHQAGVLLLGVAFIAALLVRPRESGTRGDWRVKIALLALLLALAVAKAVWTSVPGSAHYDSYAAQQATWSAAAQMWREGVAGMPLLGLACMWAAGGLAASRGGRAMPFAVALAAVAGVVWLGWNAAPERWSSAIHYRRWVVPLALPFFALAVIEARRRAPAPDRSALAATVATVFALVLLMQAATWHSLTTRLVAAMDAPPTVLVPHEAMDLAGLRGTPVDHWGVTCYAMALQGRTPRKYLAFDPECAAALDAEPPMIALWRSRLVPPSPGPAGWFDHRPMLRARYYYPGMTTP